MDEFEKYISVYKNEEGVTIRPQGEEAKFSFELDKKKDKRYRLFTAGSTELFKWWKSEYGIPTLYYTIHDALDSEHAKKARYCLNLSCKEPKEYVKRVYKKILWRPKYYYIDIHNLPTEWHGGILAKANNLKIEEGGYLRLKFEVRYKKPNVSRHSILEAADETQVIEFPAGTYDYTDFSCKINVPHDAANVTVLLEGKCYSGEFYVESPYFRGDDIDLLPDFGESAPNKIEFDWCAMHLSRKEWPEFEVRLNGEVVYSGEVFERSHCASEWEITLPEKLLKAKNEISYRLISDYHDPLPYTFYEVALIEQTGGEFSVISVQKTAATGGKARVLVRTEKENAEVKFTCASGALKGEKSYLFKEKGLHGIALDCAFACENAEFTLEYNEKEYKSCVERIAQKSDDGIITGTGDLIYVHQDEESFEEFLSWYISNGIGDLITVRPAYRWAGTRLIGKPAWHLFTRVVNELDMKYVHMVDGRDAPGQSTQPDEKLLAGKGFLGRQGHEIGGNWYMNGGANNNAFGWLQDEIRSFTFDDYPEYTAAGCDRKNWILDGEVRWARWKSGGVTDYQEAYNRSVPEVRKIREAGRVTRVTDPSYTFKYMRDAGYTWFGAETMYSSMEPQMALLRGICKDADVKDFGTHNAVQWCSSPHDTPECNRRYRLALYLSYMLGASTINTEEGLWRLEEYFVRFNRFSDGCRLHLKEQQDLVKYISTHTRSGEFYTPFAVMQGRLDGYNSQVGTPWGIHARPTQAEDSWLVLNEFYPHYELCCIYRHGCSTTEQQGWYTGTPYGNVNILPMEGKETTVGGYKTYIFTGYNKGEKQDFDKLFKALEQGGTALLTLAHFNDVTDMERIRAYDLEFTETAKYFAEGEPEFVTAHCGGKEVSVCKNVKTSNAEILEKTDEGLPLVLRYAIGNGAMILFNAKAYPVHVAIDELYRSYIRKLAENTAQTEHVWASCDKTVDFAFYKQGNGDMHAYFLAVDWYHDPEEERRATLRIGTNEYTVRFPFGTMVKAVISKDDAFAYACGEDGEVLSVNKNELIVQGTGKQRFVYGKDGKTTEIELDFSGKPVQTVQL